MVVSVADSYSEACLTRKLSGTQGPGWSGFRTISGKGLTAVITGSKPDNTHPCDGISKIATAFLLRHYHYLFVNTYGNKAEPLPRPLPNLPLNIDIGQPREASPGLLYFSLANFAARPRTPRISTTS